MWPHCWSTSHSRMGKPPRCRQVEHAHHPGQSERALYSPSAMSEDSGKYRLEVTITRGWTTMNVRIADI